MSELDFSKHYKMYDPVKKELNCNHCKFQVYRKKIMIEHLKIKHTELFPEQTTLANSSRSMDTASACKPKGTNTSASKPIGFPTSGGRSKGTPSSPSSSLDTPSSPSSSLGMPRSPSSSLDTPYSPSSSINTPYSPTSSSNTSIRSISSPIENIRVRSPPNAPTKFGTLIETLASFLRPSEEANVSRIPADTDSSVSSKSSFVGSPVRANSLEQPGESVSSQKANRKRRFSSLQNLSKFESGEERKSSTGLNLGHSEPKIPRPSILEPPNGAVDVSPDHSTKSHVPNIEGRRKVQRDNPQAEANQGANALSTLGNSQSSGAIGCPSPVLASSQNNSGLNTPKCSSNSISESGSNPSISSTPKTELVSNVISSQNSTLDSSCSSTKSGFDSPVEPELGPNTEPGYHQVKIHGDNSKSNSDLELIFNSVRNLAFTPSANSTNNRTSHLTLYSTSNLPPCSTKNSGINRTVESANNDTHSYCFSSSSTSTGSPLQLSPSGSENSVKMEISQDVSVEDQMAKLFGEEPNGSMEVSKPVSVPSKTKIPKKSEKSKLKGPRSKQVQSGSRRSSASDSKKAPSYVVEDLESLNAPKSLFWGETGLVKHYAAGFHCKDPIFKELTCDKCPVTSFSRASMIKHIKEIHD